jgi:hypothetical protein
VNGPSDGIEKARALLALLCGGVAEEARSFLNQWPETNRDSPGHTAVAQFVVDLDKQADDAKEQLKAARRASGENGWRA